MELLQVLTEQTQVLQAQIKEEKGRVNQETIITIMKPEK